MLALALTCFGCDGSPSTMSCESSRECSAAGLVCDVLRGVCVECVSDVDCLSEGEVCRSQQCIETIPCVSSRECPGLVCDPSRGFCVECVSDVDCPDEQRCDGEGFCREAAPPCVSDRECSARGLVCDTAAGECVECVRDADCLDERVCRDRICLRDIDAGPAPTDAGSSGLDGGPSDSGASLSDDAGTSGSDAGTDGGPPPICVPGSVLVLFDVSGSMAESPSGGGSAKYARAAMALNDVLAAVSDDVPVGLMFFPDGSTADCSTPIAAPVVPVGPLSSTRSLISSALASTAPDGAVTPLYRGVLAAHDALATATAPRSLLVIVDGADNCVGAPRTTALTRVASEASAGTRTHVVGLEVDDNDPSRLADAGSTRVDASCLAMCAAGDCTTDDDCGGTTTCAASPIGGFMVCQCSGTALCPEPLTCTTDPFVGNTCTGDPNCCHRNVSGSNFDLALRNELMAVFGAAAPGCL